MTFDVRFIDAGRSAQEKPDPAFPNGIDVNLSEHALQKTCCRNLPYPAPRCGQYLIVCRVCRHQAVITVAGRPDDPRTVTIPCKAKGLS